MLGLLLMPKLRSRFPEFFWPSQKTSNLEKYADIIRYITIGGKYLLFVSSRSVKMRGFSFLSLYKSVFIFQFLTVKMYNYGKKT